MTDSEYGTVWGNILLMADASRAGTQVHFMSSIGIDRDIKMRSWGKLRLFIYHHDLSF